MILALNNMKGFDTDVLAVLKQTTTTPLSTVSTTQLPEPQFAVGALVESEAKTEVTNQRNKIDIEEELSLEIESDLQAPILPNSELIDLLQGAPNPDSKGGSVEVNCKEELDDVREAKTMPDIESNKSLTDNTTFIDPDNGSSTETDVPKLGGLLLADTTTTTDFMQSTTTSIPQGNSSLSPANKLQSEVIFSRSSNQAVVIASAVSVSLLLFALLILLAYFVKKHRKKLLLWMSQWKAERSQSQQVLHQG